MNKFIFLIEVPSLAPANMWTRKDIKEFKDQIRKEKDAVIKISSGETVTVCFVILIYIYQKNIYIVGSSTNT